MSRDYSKYAKFIQQPINKMYGKIRKRYLCPHCSMVWHRGSLKSDRYGFYCPMCYLKNGVKLYNLESWLHEDLEQQRAGKYL